LLAKYEQLCLEWTKVSARQTCGFFSGQLWMSKQVRLYNRPHINQGLQLTQGYLKCNVDATFYDTAGATCWGWCLCEYQGRVILACTNVIQARHNTIEGEVMTMKEAIGELIQKATLMW
jgi:hypothetical protein